MIKIHYSFMPKQDILLGINFDNGVYTNEETQQKRNYTRIMLGVVIFNVSVFFFT